MNSKILFSAPLLIFAGLAYGAGERILHVVQRDGLESTFSIMSTTAAMNCRKEQAECIVPINVKSVTVSLSPDNQVPACVVNLELPAYVLLKKRPKQSPIPVTWKLNSNLGGQLVIDSIKIAQKTTPDDDGKESYDYVCNGVGLEKASGDTNGYKGTFGKYPERGNLVCHYDVRLKLTVPELGLIDCHPVDPVVVIQD